VFKTYYLVTTNARFHHEHDNRAYAAVPYWLAESISTAIGSVVFIPGITIAYFMVSGRGSEPCRASCRFLTACFCPPPTNQKMHLPGHTYGFTLLVLYILCLCAEAGVHFVAHFFKDAAYAAVATQCLMVVLSLFTTGSLIEPDKVWEGWGVGRK